MNKEFYEKRIRKLDELDFSMDRLSLKLEAIGINTTPYRSAQNSLLEYRNNIWAKMQQEKNNKIKLDKNHERALELLKASYEAAKSPHNMSSDLFYAIEEFLEIEEK